MTSTNPHAKTGNATPHARTGTPKKLNQLIADQWEAWMRWDPLFATSCGDHRFNDRLPDAGEEHYVTWRKQLATFANACRRSSRDSTASV